MSVLDPLTKTGLVVSMDGGQLLVSPRDRITPEVRAYITEHRQELVDALSSPPPLPPETQQAIAESIEERAAIREFEGREPREVAEREARASMRVFNIHVDMGPGQPSKWATMLAPGCSLEEARREAVHRFGAGRVLDVRGHRGGTR